MEINEKFLYHIWDQRHLLPELFTVSGKPVKIIYQGQYNTSNGPDFRHAVINVGGETLQGDVEIHQKTYDWTAHQHQEDFAYNQTILHVVLEHKGNSAFTVREDAQEIEILELKNQIDGNIAKLFQDYTSNPDLQSYGLCDFGELSSDEQLIILLRENSWERFLRKGNRFNAELQFSSFDQLLYTGFMEAMGYDKNKFNTLSIAYHYPWELLTKWRQEGMDAITLAAIWLNYSGLPYQNSKLLSDELKGDLEKAFELQTWSIDKAKLQWNLFRIRPANHPLRRLLQAAYVITPLADKGFLSTLLPVFERAELSKMNKFIRSLYDVLTPKPSNYREIGQPGLNLILTLTGNIILPIVYLYAAKVNNPTLQNKTGEMYIRFPHLNENYITKFMRNELALPKRSSIFNSYAQQQGLMNLYYKYCNYHLCELCLAERQKLLQNM
ncbi:MAG TPA: DUF2851 family protein [Candidatus Cloacimonadota bacterium]|nr:DUF2851 family protein [Candidatus Cloacimonadota bacterium]